MKEPVRLTARAMKLIKAAVPLQPAQTVVEDVVQQEEQLALQLQESPARSFFLTS